MSAAAACGETNNIENLPGVGGAGGNLASDISSGTGGTGAGGSGATNAAGGTGGSNASGGTSAGTTQGGTTAKSASAAGGSGGTSDDSSNSTESAGGASSSSAGGTAAGGTGNLDGNTGPGGAGGQPTLGDSCSDAISVDSSGSVFSAPAFGAFAFDFTLAGAGCSASAEGAADAVFEVSLAAGEQLSVTEAGDLSAVINLQSTCEPSAACIATSAGDSETLTYEADADTSVYVVVHSAEPLASATGYAIHIDIDRECGNGVVEGGETCDDNDTEENDGCSPECSIDPGYGCSGSPSVCERLSLGSYGVGDAFSPFAGSVVATDESEYRFITITERVILNLLITAPVGDPDFYLFDDSGSEVGSAFDTGQVEDLRIGLEPGVYLFQIQAYDEPLAEGYTLEVAFEDPGVCGDGAVETEFEVCDSGGAPGCSSPSCEVVWGWECTPTSPSVCTEIPELDALGAGDSLEFTQSVAVAGGESEYLMLTVSEDVLLSGSLVSGNSPEGDPDLYFELEGGELFRSDDIGDESFADLVVPAGTYRIRVHAFRTLEQGYVLSLSTQSP